MPKKTGGGSSPNLGEVARGTSAQNFLIFGKINFWDIFQCGGEV